MTEYYLSSLGDVNQQKWAEHSGPTDGLIAGGLQGSVDDHVEESELDNQQLQLLITDGEPTPHL